MAEADVLSAIESLQADVSLIRKLLSNRTVEEVGSVTVYDDDGTTPVGTMTWANGERGAIEVVVS